MTAPSTLWDAMERAAATAGRLTLLSDGATREAIPYADLRTRALARASALAAHGVVPGDRVVLVAATTSEVVADFFALLRLGAIPSPQAPPAPFGDLGDYAERLAATAAYLGARCVIAPAPVREDLARRLDGAPVLAPPSDGDPELAPSHCARPSDVAFIQCTSGSTGHPKGVVLGHDNVLANVEQIAAALGITPADRVVSWLPLHHDMGLVGCLVLSVCLGLDLSLLPPHLFLRRPSCWLQAVSSERATLSPAPNFAYSYAAARVSEPEAAALDLASWRVALCGAEPIDARVLRAFAARFAPHGLRADALTPCYGLAEATLAVTFHGMTSPVEVDRLDRAALASAGIALLVPEDVPGIDVVSSGRPLPGTEVKIVDRHGATLPEARAGRVQVRGPSVMRGYFELPRESRDTLRDGWLDTGDEGYLRGGALFLTGRVKDVIIIRGRNHPPTDFEWAAQEVPGVRRGGVVAFGLGDEAEGTEALYLVCETEVDAGAHEALARDVRARVLAHTSVCPREVVLVPKGFVPKTSSGKLQRRKARELYVQSHPAC
ncbi:MAG: fatty acyl-AMP ligase [Acidobacteriota bacterium]